MKKILIIRFSSIGDLTQALSLPRFIKKYEPQSEIHFLTRSDLAELAQLQTDINFVWSYDRKSKLKGIFKLAKEITKHDFDIIYDAHYNARSRLFSFLISSNIKIAKKINRIKRFLLLNFKINLFEKPFSGQRDLIQPLEKIGYTYFLPDAPIIKIPENITNKLKSQFSSVFLQNPFVVLAPSAAYELKRWPIEHFNQLIQMNSDLHFVILAGPTDAFTQHLNRNLNVTNLTGQLSLIESAGIIDLASAVISNDTGLLHISEQLGKKTIALMGPAPFGFPSRSSTTILERDLNCRPCSKHGQGPCTNSIYQACMTTILPEEVSFQLRKILIK